MRSLLVVVLMLLALALPVAASAMDGNTASYWANVDAALLRNAHGYSYTGVDVLYPWGGGWGTYGWTARAYFGAPGVYCLKYINLWGSYTQEGWNTYGGSCPW